MAQRRSPQDLVLAERLTAQLLAGPPAADPLAATGHLLAVQAQDPRAARLALRVRSRTRHASEIDDALTRERSLVITWVNRGTLHLIAAEDEALLHQLTTPQLRTGTRRRLSQEGVSPAAAQRGVDIIVGALTDGPLTRSEIRERLEAGDIPVAGQALVHILFLATLDGWIIRGPMVGAEQGYVLREDWLGPRPALDRDQALAELAHRYLVGHGPADERDLAKWAQLSLRDTRAALRSIAGRLHTRPDGLLELSGRPAAQPLPPPRLLGPFEPVLLGWSSRELILTRPEHVVTANGIFKAIVLVDGRAAGTWTLPGGRPELSLWTTPTPSVASALERECVAVSRYLAPEPDDG
jgi:hypothetical protein